MRKTLLALLAVLIIPVSGYCSDLSSHQTQALKDINTTITVTHQLTEDKQITPAQETQIDNFYLQQAGKIVGHDVSESQLQTLLSNSDKTEGLGVFLNALCVLAGILGIIGVIGVIGWLLKDVLEDIPKVVFEFLGYVGSGVLCLSGYFWSPTNLGIVHVDPIWFVVPGALALIACFTATYGLHFKTASSTIKAGPGFFNFPTVMCGLLTVAWTGMALFYHNLFPDGAIPYVLAFGAVMALQAFLGFSVITMPGCIAMGWETDRQVPKSVFSSLLILAVYIGLALKHGLTGNVGLFAPGAIFMGAFVYYIGLVVMSSKWYVWHGKRGRDGSASSDKIRYLALQVFTTLSGLAALYLGTNYHIGALLGVGGTFFAIFLLEKYYEIPWKGVGVPVSFVGAAAFLYFVIGYATRHPQYFVWGIR